MNSHFPQHSHSGFSILMAIGTIAVLLVLVSSLAITYIRESKITRFLYNDILSVSVAEGNFEYAMLKVKNHKDGFQDTVTSIEPDGKILELNSIRSRGLHSEYSIVASSTGHSFDLRTKEHLIIPLFASDETSIGGGVQSKNPTFYTGAKPTTDLSITGIGELSWSIIAMSGSETVAITGSGDISPIKEGIQRINTNQCYSKIDGSTKSCESLSLGDEEIIYAYDEAHRIGDFLSEKKDAYFVLYNSDASDREISVSSTLPFSLPTISVTSIAKKGESSQFFQFIEDKGKYYDALKYGIYNIPH